MDIAVFAFSSDTRFQSGTPDETSFITDHLFQSRYHRISTGKVTDSFCNGGKESTGLSPSEISNKQKQQGQD